MNNEEKRMCKNIIWDIHNELDSPRPRKDHVIERCERMGIILKR